MTQRERLFAAANLEPVDRIPAMGGWLAWAPYLQELASITPEQYWEDPFGHGVEAYRALECDGLMGVFLPAGQDAYRALEDEVWKDNIHQAQAQDALEQIVKGIEALPSPAETLRNFDFAAGYEQFVGEYLRQQAICGDMVWMPSLWDVFPNFIDYAAGYANHLLLIGMYPEAAARLWEHNGARARLKSQLVAKAQEEHQIYPALLTGPDLCSLDGPLVSPRVLRELYFPQLHYAFEPLLEAGIKLVWHCDGNVQPLLEDILQAGVAGLQGFQSEAGMQFEELVKLRTREGRPLIFWAGASVTRDLPLKTPAQITAQFTSMRQQAEREGASLWVFTSNTIVKDTKLENLHALYGAPRE